jgi:hypothetical protein
MTRTTTQEPDDNRNDGQRSPRQQRRRANGEGTIGRRKDGRYEAKAFVRRSDGTYVRRSIYGKPEPNAVRPCLSFRPAPKAVSRSAPRP